MGDLRSICSRLAGSNVELTDKCVKDNTRLDAADVAQMDELCSGYTKADFASCIKDKRLNMSAFRLSDENLNAICRRILSVSDKIAWERCTNKYKNIMNDEALRIISECKKVTFAETETCADSILCH